MNLLLTGASGFLGRNVLPLLKVKYNVSTMGLSDSNDIKVDLANEIPILSQNYDIILHAAGKAHSVINSDEQKKSFFDVNLQGTINLCMALEKSKLPKVFVFVSTVAVYGLEFGNNITENYPLNGSTPYALSKIQAERFLKEWCVKNDVKLAIIRPSLIAGVNAPGNLGAMVNGIKTGKYFSIGKGNAQKSILMVQDIAELIPRLIEKGGVYNVCDDQQPSFRELESIICKQLNKKMPPSIPLSIAKGIALIGDIIGVKAPINSLKLRKITKSLTFSNEKAKKELKWQPLNVLDNYHL